MGAIYQYPCGHMLIDSLIHFPIHHTNQHPPNGGACFIFLQSLIIMKNNLCLWVFLLLNHVFFFFFFFFLTKFINYIIHVNFVFKHFRNSQTYYPPKTSAMQSFVISINQFLIGRRELFFGIVKMIISYYQLDKCYCN